MGLAALLLWLPAVSMAQPTRVLSLNLCADILLLEQAPPAAALLLTRLARNPDLSPHAIKATAHGQHRGLAEEMLAFKPDWVVLEAGQWHPALPLLTRTGARTLALEPASHRASHARNLQRLARVWDGDGSDTTDSANSANSANSADSADSADAVLSPDTADSALFLSGGRWVPGPETLADDMLAAGGFRDLRGVYGLEAGGEIGLEALVRRPPDFLVLSVSGSGSFSLDQEVLSHRALRRTFGPRHIIPLPESSWVCASSATAGAMEALHVAHQMTPATEHAP